MTKLACFQWDLPFVFSEDLRIGYGLIGLVIMLIGFYLSMPDSMLNDIEFSSAKRNESKRKVKTSEI